MSKNISKLSGRIGLRDNLFVEISRSSLNSDNGKGIKDIKEIAEKYKVGVSTIHGAESFYEFLRPSHREKKAFVCNGSACMCAGTQEPLKEKLKEKLGNDKVGEMFCLGYCYENHAFHYDGKNYAGEDIKKIDQINPQMAARLCTAFETIDRLEPNRQDLMKSSLKKIRFSDNISRDTLDISNRILKLQ